MPHIGIFLLGFGAALVLKVVGGASLGRKAMKSVIKGGIVVSRKMQEFASEVTEELQDVTAEASAEVDHAASKVSEA